jgi:hypothetical protein
MIHFYKHLHQHHLSYLYQHHQSFIISPVQWIYPSLSSKKPVVDKSGQRIDQEIIFRFREL